MTDPGPLDTVERFSDRAEDYVRYRPGYPADAIHTIVEGLGPPGDLVAADVGAGTGISARLLGDRGLRVVAVEPGLGMRAAAAPHSNVRWMAGRAEATGLRSMSVDLVVCAQSFHWFRIPETLTEFARILRPGGRLAIVWNRRSRTDPFTADYRRAIVDVGGETTMETTGFDPGAIVEDGLFSAPVRTSVPNSQRLDLEGLIGRSRSASYVPRSGAAGVRLVDLLRALYAQYADADGFVTLVYETDVFCSQKI